MGSHWKSAKYKPPKVDLESALEGNELILVLKAQLWLENLVNRLLEEHLDVNEFDFDRQTFSRKLSLALALGVVPRHLANSLRLANKLRNTFAHDIDAQLSTAQINELVNSLPGVTWADLDKGKNRDAVEILRQALAVLIYTLRLTLANTRDNRVLTDTALLVAAKFNEGKEVADDPRLAGESWDDYKDRRTEEDRAARKEAGED